MPTLPFSNYIGPGNPIQNGDPKNLADIIAKVHDIAYTTAQNSEDIRVADYNAITDFVSALFSGADPIQSVHALLGAVGLQVKTAIESYLDTTLYPSR